MRSCCFCDAPIEPYYDFCKPCKDQYTALFGDGWTDADWFQATVTESRRLHRLEAADQAHGVVSIETYHLLDPAGMGRSRWHAQPLEPIPQLAAALRAIIETALQVDAGTGWRKMHALVQAKGITATARQVRYRLDQIRAERTKNGTDQAVGQSGDMQHGGS